MPRLGLVDFQARGLHLCAQRQHLGAGLLGTLDPGFHTHRDRGAGCKPRHIQNSQRLCRLAHQHLQAPAGELHVLLRLQLLRQYQIHPSLRFIDIRARTRAGRKALAGGIELRGVILLLGANQAQLITCQQGIEIRLGHACDQRLLVPLQRRIRILDLRLGLTHQRTQVGSVQGLSHRQRLAAAVILVLVGHRLAQHILCLAGQVIAGARSAQRHVGQALGAGLWQTLAAGIGGRAGGADRRIICMGRLIGLAQIQRPRWQRHGHP